MVTLYFVCNGVANLNVPVLIYTRSSILPAPHNPCWSHTQCLYDPCMTHCAKLIGWTEPSLGRQTAVGSLLRRGSLGTVHWAGWKARKGAQWWLLKYQPKTLLCRVYSSHLVTWGSTWISYPPLSSQASLMYCTTNGSSTPVRNQCQVRILSSLKTSHTNRQERKIISRWKQSCQIEFISLLCAL